MKHIARIGWLGIAAVLAVSPIPLHADPAMSSPVPALAPEWQGAPILLLADMASGQTFDERDADRRFVPASVTKVMTAYVAFEMIGKGQLSPNQMFTVDDDTFGAWSGKGSSMFLKRGETISVDSLLHGITTVSANDGSVALAVGAAGSIDNWVARMNRTARDLGMTNSHFGTPNGWPDEGRTFTTARDLATLARAMILRHPDLYARYFGKRGFSHNGFTQNNHDPITGIVPGADGIKTGFTRQAGYTFLGSAERGGQRLLMVVAGVDHPADRARISRDLIEWGFATFRPKQIFPAGARIGTARVQGGAARRVALLTSSPVLANLLDGEKREITLDLRYRGPLKAPISRGAKVAELEVRIDGLEPYRIPLEAAEEIPEANAWQRLVNGVLGIVS